MIILVDGDVRVGGVGSDILAPGRESLCREQVLDEELGRVLVLGVFVRCRGGVEESEKG